VLVNTGFVKRDGIHDETGIGKKSCAGERVEKSRSAYAPSVASDDDVSTGSDRCHHESLSPRRCSVCERKRPAPLGSYPVSGIMLQSNADPSTTENREGFVFRAEFIVRLEQFNELSA